MGYMRHHSIIVTGWNFDLIDIAHEKAKGMGLHVTDIVKGECNGYLTFCVVPDGSKEGWNDSEDFDYKRERFKEWLHANRYEDDSSPYDWVEIQFGDGNYESKIIEDSEKYLREKHA